MLKGEGAFDRATVGVGILMGLGVLATLGREVLLARIFGTGAEIETFRLAFAVPNLLGTSLAAVIVAALIPHIQADAGLARALAATALLAGILAALGLVTIPLQVAVLAPGFDAAQRDYLGMQMPLLWIFFLLLALSFGPRAFLSSRGTVWPMASSSLVLGATMALGLVAIAAMPVEQHTATALATLAIIAAALVLITHIVALPRGALVGAWRDRRGARLGSIVMLNGTLVIVLLGHLLSAAPRLIDRAAGTEIGAGTVAALDYSFAIITVPGIAFGTVFVVAAIPRLAAAVRDQARDQFALLERRALLFIGLGTASGLVIAVAGAWLIGLVYGGGAFDAAAVDLTAGILRWHALALGPMVATIILAQAALTIGLTRAFVIVAALRLAGKWLSVQWLVPAFGVDGLAASFIVPELLSTVVLAALIWRWRQRFVHA